MDRTPVTVTAAGLWAYRRRRLGRRTAAVAIAILTAVPGALALAEASAASRTRHRPVATCADASPSPAPRSVRSPHTAVSPRPGRATNDDAEMSERGQDSTGRATSSPGDDDRNASARDKDSGERDTDNNLSIPRTKPCTSMRSPRPSTSARPHHRPSPSGSGDNSPAPDQSPSPAESPSPDESPSPVDSPAPASPSASPVPSASPSATSKASPTSQPRTGSITISGNQTAQLANGEYELQGNEWNSSAALTLTSDGSPDFQIAASAISTATNGAPGAYPSIYRGCHWGSCTPNSGLPISLSNAERPGAVTTSIQTTVTSGGAWDDAYDIWFNASSTTSNNSSNGLEMMVWLNRSGGVQPAGSVVASMSRLADTRGTSGMAGLGRAGPSPTCWRRRRRR